MKNIISTLVILTIVLLANNNCVFAQYPDDAYGTSRIKNTQVYVGDPNTTEIQKKIDLIDAEITKLEKKREAELKSLDQDYKDYKKNTKPEKKKKEATKPEKKKNKYSLADQVNSSDSSDDVVPTTNTVVETPNTDNQANNYEAIIAKYEELIVGYNNNKQTLIATMTTSKGNYIAANTNPYGATMIWSNVNGGNSTTNNNNANNNSSVQTTVLCLRNMSENWSIEITDGEFKGVKLWSRKGALIATSIYKPVPVGNYVIKYTAYKNGSDQQDKREVNVSVYPGKPTIDFMP